MPAVVRTRKYEKKMDPIKVEKYEGRIAPIVKPAPKKPKDPKPSPKKPKR